MAATIAPGSVSGAHLYVPEEVRAVVGRLVRPRIAGSRCVLNTRPPNDMITILMIAASTDGLFAFNIDRRWAM